MNQERYNITLIMDASDLIDSNNNPKIFTMNSSNNVKSHNFNAENHVKLSSTASPVIFDVYLDNLTTYSASYANSSNTMAFIVRLEMGDGSVIDVQKTVVCGSSDALQHISNNKIIVPNESKNPSDVCVSHKARKMNYVGTYSKSKLTSISFKISFLDGTSIFKDPADGRVIAEYILVRRKD